MVGCDTTKIKRSNSDGGATYKPCSSTWKSQLQLPGFSCQVITKGVVPLFAGQAEAGLFVDVPGGMEDALRPERDLSIACLAGKAHTFAHQAGADAQPPRRRLNQQQAQLGHGLRLFDQEDGAYDLTIFLGDPAALPFGVVMLNELGDDASDQGLKAFVPSVLLGIKHAVAVHDPSHIAGLMRPKNIRRLRFRLGFRLRLGPDTEQFTDGMHCANQLALFGSREGLQQETNLLLRTLIQRSKSLQPLLGQQQQALTAIGF